MEEGKKFKSITSYLNMLNMIFYVLVGIPLTVFLLIYLQNKAQISANPALGEKDFYLKVFAGFFIVIVIILGELVFKKRMRQDFTQHFLESKLHEYFQASIRRYFGYAISGIVSVAMLAIYLEVSFVALYVIGLFSFSLIRPTKKSIMKVGIFSEEEKDIISQEDIIP